MKKGLFIGLVFAFIISTVLTLFSCSFENENKLNSYELTLNFDDNTMTLEGQERIEYVNNSDNMFTNLFFHLYPNAFREGAKNTIVSQLDKDDAYPNGESYGQITINKVYNEQGDLDFVIEGEDKNILNISLQEELYPDEKVVIKIDFVVSLANINHRLGYGENTINFGNFYPIACVYENGKGFSKDLYHSNGDPFYSDCSNYNVLVTYPSSYKLASSGEIVNTTQDEDKVCSEILGTNIRDFCFVLSKKFEIVITKVDGIDVYYYGYVNDDNLQSCLEISAKAITTFNDLFGDYPYSQISVVKSNFVQGGMEYPNIVLISDKYKQQEDYNYVIVHEIAHQWWYGVVGNDEYNHAWQDEGLAEYSTLLFFRENSDYGIDFDSCINNTLTSYKLFEKIYLQVTGEVDGRMDRPLNEFKTEPEYVQCTYNKGVLLFNTIEETIGENKFLKTLKTYYKSFKFKNASPADMISCFNKVYGQQIETLFYSWIEGKVVIV